MTVFELSAVLTPVIGSIAGVMSVKTPGIIPAVLGFVIGLAIGVVLYFSAIGVTTLFMRVPGVTTAKRLSVLQWLASMAAVLPPMLSPIGAFWLCSFVVTKLLHF